MRKIKIIVFLVVTAVLLGLLYWFGNGRYIFQQFLADRQASEAGLKTFLKVNGEISAEEIAKLREKSGTVLMTEEDFLGKDLEENLKSRKSDIEGMTKWDKYQMGLSTEKGSDSDADGLTDKEEIETYKTDPLKQSTAGDLYTDGYKVEHGMDPLQKYEYEGAVEFKYNELEMFQFEAVNPKSLDAYARKVKNNWNMSDDRFSQVFDGYDVLGEYIMYNAYGHVQIDVKKLCEKNDTEIGDVVIIISECMSQGWKEVDCTVNGTVLTPEIELDGGTRYVAIATSHSFLSGVLGSLGLKNDEGANLSGKRAGDGLVAYTKASEFVGGKPSIYYVKSGDKKIDRKAVEKLLDVANFASETDTLADGRTRPNGLVDPSTVKDVQYISQTEMDLKVKLFETFTPAKCKANPRVLWASIDSVPAELLKITSWCMWCTGDLIDGYYTDDTPDEEENGENKEEKGKVDNGFRLKSDAFQFPNFGSVYAPGGNCAGIARITRLLWDNRQFAVSGVYTIDDRNVDWNLHDDDNKTLTDPGLGDYKTENFTSSHTGQDNLLDQGLSDSENEFVKMIGCLWREENDITRNAKINISTDDNRYTGDMIREAAKRLDNGEILGVGLEMGGIYNLASEQTEASAVSYHEVIVYGYEKINDFYRFYIYDSNYPNDKLKHNGTVYNIERNELKVWINKDDTIDWEWLPEYVTSLSRYENPGYGAWSRTGHRLYFICGESTVLSTRESDKVS